MSQNLRAGEDRGAARGFVGMIQSMGLGIDFT